MPTLTPKTKEVWAGIRSLASMVSALQAEVDQLRSQLSGFDAYKKWLRDQSGFQEYDTNLTAEAEDITEVSEADVTETVNLLSTTFASWSAYKGDPSSGSGVYAQTTYDDYRSYLTSAGASSVEADRHIQLLKEVFDPGRAFSEDTASHTDWEAFKQELINNGVSTSNATSTVEDLQTVFTSVGAMDREVLGSDSWSDFENYLVANGLSGAEANAVVQDLKTAYGNTLDSSSKDSFSAWDSWSDFETYLTNNGFTASEASDFVDKLKDQYASFDEFRKEVLSGTASLEELLNQAQHGATTDDSALGVHIYDEPGTEDDLSMGEGAVSVRFADKLNFHRVNQTDDEETSGDVISWGSISAEKTTAIANETVTVSAEVTNSASAVAQIAANLIVNGQLKQVKNVQIPGNATRSVGFDVNFIDAGSKEIQINDSGTVTIEVNVAGNL